MYERDITMMNSPQDWPQPKILCVKSQEVDKSTGMPNCAVLRMVDGEFEIWQHYDDGGQFLERYNSAEDVVNVGKWRVD